MKNSQAKTPAGGVQSQYHRLGIPTNPFSHLLQATHPAGTPPLLHHRRHVLAVRHVVLAGGTGVLAALLLFAVLYVLKYYVQAHGPSSLRHRHSRFGSYRD